MHIRSKIFLQFFSSWTLMPLALFWAQVEGVAQKAEFVNAILVITSLAPVQVYINEVFAPAAVRYKQRLGLRHGLEIALAIMGLTGWLTYRLDLDVLPSLVIGIFAQGYVWLSYKASRCVLEYQADSIIGGRYSYLIGSIIPLTFLLIIVIYWAVQQVGWGNGSFLYLLILLPNAAQYLYTLFGWMAKNRIHPVGMARGGEALYSRMHFSYFGTAMAMAAISQNWKVELANAAAGFAALSIYLISPFSSMWLIFSKSKYMTKSRPPPSILKFWGAPLLVGLTLFLHVDGFGWIFPLALVTQVSTFKFITDIRLKSIPIS